MGFGDVIQAGNEAFAPSSDETLLPYIRLHFLQKSGAPDYRPGFRGSQVGKMCCREEVFKVLLPRSYAAPSADLQAIFDVGHAVHERWQNHVLGPAGILEGWWHCRTCGWKVEGVMPGDICPKCNSLRRCGSCRAKLRDGVYQKGHHCAKCKSESWEYEEYTLRNEEHGIVGHCDGVLNLGGQRYIWEFKTINRNGFENRISFTPLREHVFQVQVYMWLKNIKKAIIHYINKDTAEQREFLVEYEDSFRKDILRKIEVVKRGIENQSLPDHKVCSSTRSWRAKSCPWVKECFSAKIFHQALKEIAEGSNE